MMANKLVVFVFVTVGLAYVSRASLANPRTHGFYRFFAWEAILALMLLNLDAWFHDPFSWHQLVSWLFLGIAAFLVICGALTLRRVGKRSSQREDPALLEFEKTTRLVTSGVYHYIRHPMYSSLLFLAWGAFFKSPSWVGGVLALASTLLLVATGRVEEARDIDFFGEDYREYMKESKMFIPYLL